MAACLNMVVSIILINFGKAFKYNCNNRVEREGMNQTNRKMCIDCKKLCFSARYSKTFNCVLCDECYTDRNDAREDEIVTSCHSIEE